jgi:hypothetical protein
MVYDYDTGKLCDLVEFIAGYNKVMKNTEAQSIVRMQRLCYFCDFDHFEMYGQSLTDCIYVRTPKGPTPIFFHEALRELVTDGRVFVDGNDIMPSESAIEEVEKTCMSIAPFSKKWSNNELLSIMQTVKKYSAFEEKKLCELSRKDNPCQIAGEYQALSYYAAFYRRPFYVRRGEDE